MRKQSFRGGIHPLRPLKGAKDGTKGKAIRDYASDTVVIPMDMHLGAPSQPTVKKGDRVLLGQVIAEPGASRGLPVHASVSGEVKDVVFQQLMGKKKSQCVIIQNDFKDEWVPLTPLGDVEHVDVKLIVPAVRDAGISGMGGASFPTYCKMTLPEGVKITDIIVNGAECETFLTADHRLMLENPHRIVDGLRATMRAVGAERGIIAIEDNKPDAINTMREAARARNGISVMSLKTKYPQGGEKQLIKAVLGKEVPSGGLPMHVNALVLNVATAAAIADAIIEGKPVTSRVTTVTGAVRDPQNLRVRIGTVLQDAVGGCGGYAKEPGKIFFGGSMTGVAVPNDLVPIGKANNGVVVLDQQQAEEIKERHCIRCARCVDSCPMGLNPYRLHDLCLQGDLAQAKKENLMECILCGSCSYVCPARRWMAPSFKDGKEVIAERGIGK